MTFKKKLAQFVKTCDFFSTTEFLRYKEESDYKTTSGGIISIGIIVVFAILFTSIAIKTVDRQIITYSIDNSNDQDPTLTTVQNSPSAKFVMGVGIVGLDLSDTTKRYFDIALESQSFHTIVNPISNVVTPLVPCTEEHFDITHQIKKLYTDLRLSAMLCLPIGFTFDVQGKATSQALNMLTFSVKKCNSSLSAIPCASDLEIATLQAAMGSFTMLTFFVNPIINPSSQNYLDFYFQDRNYITFTTTLGSQLNGAISDYSIITDMSIMPFEDPFQEDGVIFLDLFQIRNFEVTNDVYAIAQIMKSSVTLTYNRSFNKLDSLLSYIGGLFGCIIGAIFFMKAYTGAAFQFNIFQDLYKFNDENGHLACKKLNPIRYFIFSMCCWLGMIGIKLKTQAMEAYEECQQQVKKQLDIGFLLKRIIFLERAVQFLFDQSHYRCLYLQQRMTIGQAIRSRRMFKLNHLAKSDLITKQSLEKQIQNGFPDPPKMQYALKHNKIRNSHLLQQNSNEKTDQNKLKNSSQRGSIMQVRTNEIQQKCSDMNESQLSFSPQNDGQIQNLHNSLAYVLKQIQNGNEMSNRIFQNLDRQTVQKILKKKIEQPGITDQRKKSRLDKKIKLTSNIQKPTQFYNDLIIHDMK